MATGHDIAMGLRAAYRSMHRQTNLHLARRGATADQFVLLSLLVERDGTTQQELVRRATSDPNTVRAMLLLLEKQGLIVRKQHPTDGRALKITLTRKGRNTYNTLLKEIKPLQKRLAALFRDEEAKTLVAFLGRISEAMAEQPEPLPGPTRPPSGKTANC
jgi:DNA-binding MarR family transcriptional regulator